MAGGRGSLVLWIHLLLSSVIQASHSRHVHTADVKAPISQTGNSEVDRILSQFPITLPEGIDPKNINVTTITIKTCAGMKEQLTVLNRELKEATTRNTQLSEVAFGLRGDVRVLKQKLGTCTATTSAVIASRQVLLDNKMSQLLVISDNNMFLTLKISVLTNEVNILQEKVTRRINTTGVTELQAQLEEKIQELKSKTEQLERSHHNPQLILQIIALQNQIWHAERVDARRGTSSQQTTEQIQDLQEQLDNKISELQGKSGNDSAILEMISVNSKMTETQRLITVHVDQSRTQTADLQRQWRQKVELLKKKILQLSSEQSNIELTQEILVLQSEVEHLRGLMSNAKKTTDAKFKELRATLETEKKKHENLRKHLEAVDFVQAKLIMEIISIMKDVRELWHDGPDQTTVTTQVTSLQTLLQAKERESAKHQAEVVDLRRKLQLKGDQYSGPGDKYDQVKTDLEDKIAELNRRGESDVALFLWMINLNDELKALKGLISTTEDPDRLSELQRQLEDKQQQLTAKTADLERLSSNPQIILRIIALQNEIWDLQRGAANETTGHRVEELQKELDNILNGMKVEGNENTSIMLKVITLQSQVEQLLRRLSDLQTSQTSLVTKLKNQLQTKKNELQQHINELNEKNEKNANLTLTITDLQKQLRNIEREKQEDRKTSSATIVALRNKLNRMEGQCSNIQEKHDNLQKNLDTKLKELEAKSDSVTSLALQVSTLTIQLEALNGQMLTTEAETKIRELQKIIDGKNDELAKKTDELRERSSQPQRFLQIILLQTQIGNLAGNDTNYEKVAALQDELNSLIDGIKDESNGTTKLMFSIMAQQDEIKRLKRQRGNQMETYLDRIEELENDLEDARNQLKDKMEELDTSETGIANLSAQIMELLRTTKLLETEISDLKQKSSNKLAELEKKLDLKERQLKDSEDLFKASNAKNFNLIMDIADLQAQLKKFQTADEIYTTEANELKKQLKTREKEASKLDNRNKELKEKIKEMRMCCTSTDNQCDEIQRQLEQSQEDADGLRQQLREKDANFNQLQQELGEMKMENDKLQENYNSLVNEKDKLQDALDELHNKLNDVEDRTIHPFGAVLDPKTANPRIYLSAGDTKLSIGEDQQDVPDHAGRFNVALAVLGKTGFTSGRHYWEVSVAGKHCYNLGMATESAPRRGTFVIRPDRGFWTLVMTKRGQYLALDRRQVPVVLPVQPATLGILLDYKKGEISFYNAGTRAHIYSFLGQRFTDKIYPFINACVEDGENETPIVLTPVGSVDWIR